MVKKLFKHEFLSLLRLMLPVECAVLGAGILVKLMTLFETENFIFEAILVFAFLIMVVAVSAGNVAAVIFGVIRFYKNLFSTEGYLSFTLPVTPAQHIIVKAVTITVFEIIAGIVAVISFCIATSGEFLVEIFKLIYFLIEEAFVKLNPLHISLFIVELIIALVVSVFSKYLLFYSCITIGQIASKYKILAAVGVYAAYSMISGFISTVFNIVVAGMSIAFEDFSVKIGNFIEVHPYFCMHTVFLGAIIIGAIIASIFFLISNTIIKKKLNLE